MDCTICNQSFQSVSKLERHYLSKLLERHNMKMMELTEDEEESDTMRPRSPIHSRNSIVYAEAIDTMLSPSFSPETEKKEDNNVIK